MKFSDIIVLLYFGYLPHVTSEDYCIGTCYSGRLFPERKDIFHKNHLQGFSYKNITTDDPKKCYSSCIQDCRCKACQMKDARCELLDEDKTSKADNFVEGPGYVYYDLKQTMYQGKSHMVPHAGVCYNGCCRSQPCMNGGTCVEHCQSPKEKFSCKCRATYYGKVCAILAGSCMDVMKSAKSVPKDDVYRITRTDNNNVIPMYCTFVSPNQAWTLIESFALSNKSLFKNKPFYQGYRYNQSAPPSWDAFRLSGTRMKYIRSKSTLFRATCDFPKRSGSLTPDLLIGDLSDVDIINEKDISGCQKYKFVDIRGHQCTNCTALTGGLHFHLDVTYGKCDFRPPFQTHNVDSFVYYFVTGNVSKCTVTPHSTTQWWLGQER